MDKNTQSVFDKARPQLIIGYTVMGLMMGALTGYSDTGIQQGIIMGILGALLAFLWAHLHFGSKIELVGGISGLLAGIAFTPEHWRFPGAVLVMAAGILMGRMSEKLAKGDGKPSETAAEKGASGTGS